MAGGNNQLRLVASIDLTQVTRSIRQLRTQIRSTLSGESLAGFNRSLSTAVNHTNSINRNIGNIGMQSERASRSTSGLSVNLGRVVTRFAAITGLSFGFDRIRQGFATIEDASLRLTNVAGSASLATTRVLQLSRAASEAGLSFAGLSSQLIALQQVTFNAGFSPEQSLDLTRNILRAGRAITGTSVQGAQGITRNFERILTQQRFGSFEFRPLLLAGVQEAEIIQALGVSQGVGERLLAGNVPIFEGGRAARVAGVPESEQIQRTLNQFLTALAQITGDRLPTSFETLSGSTNALGNSFSELANAIGNSVRAFPLLTGGISSLSRFLSGQASNINVGNEVDAIFGANRPTITTRPRPGAATLPGAREALAGIDAFRAIGSFTERFIDTLQEPVTATSTSFIQRVSQIAQATLFTPGSPFAGQGMLVNAPLSPVLSAAINTSGLLQQGQTATSLLANLTDEQRQVLLSGISNEITIQGAGVSQEIRDRQRAEAQEGLRLAERRSQEIQQAQQNARRNLGEESAEELAREARNRQAETAIRGVSSAIGELTRAAIQARQPIQDILQQFLDTLLQTGTNALASGIAESSLNILYPDRRANQRNGTATRT